MRKYPEDLCGTVARETLQGVSHQLQNITQSGEVMSSGGVYLPHPSQKSPLLPKAQSLHLPNSQKTLVLLKNYEVEEKVDLNPLGCRRQMNFETADELLEAANPTSSKKSFKEYLN